jgi:5-methylcytosine-specific restriction endonuclease McrA
MWLPSSKVAEYRRCSPECNKKWREREKETRKKPCQTCGKIFLPRPNQLSMGHGIFCSQACNTEGRKALNTDDSKKKAADRLRELRLSGQIKYRSGADSPSWKGGKEGMHQRRLALYNDPERLKAHRQETARKLREYRKNNPEKVREFADNRAGKKLGRLPKGTVQRIGNTQKWHCAICRRGIKNAFHVDHIMPLFRGGEHSPRNIQLLCESCNVRKSSKHPIDYMQSLGFLL